MTTNDKSRNGFNNRAALPLLARVIALGYEDGPTSGTAESADGSSAYRFELLAIDVDGVYDHDAWDRGNELRIYSLTMLPPGRFEGIVAVLSRVEPPTWPVWVPGARQPSVEIDDLIIREIEPKLQQTVGMPFVVATASLLEPPRAVERPDDLAQSHDWFAWLGLEPAAVAS